MPVVGRLESLEQEAPRRFSRWSPGAWRAAVSGPASRLASALGSSPAAERTLEDYLLLVREAIGLQLVSVDDVHRLDPAHDRLHAMPPNFLATALFDVLPRLLPAAVPDDRARALAACWNAGERLVSMAPWLDRYLAARLRTLTSLTGFEAALERLVVEGLDAGTPSPWSRVAAWSVLDPTELDADFLPGEASFVAPRIAVVRDRRRPGRALGVLLRPVAEGGPAWLGGMPADGDVPPAWQAPASVRSMLLAGAGGPDVLGARASASGFGLVWVTLSQRVWVAEAA